jgi:hypothetical protein
VLLCVSGSRLGEATTPTLRDIRQFKTEIGDDMHLPPKKRQATAAECSIRNRMGRVKMAEGASHWCEQKLNGNRA